MNKVRIQTFQRKFTVRSKHKIDAKRNRKEEKEYLFSSFFREESLSMSSNTRVLLVILQRLRSKKPFFYFA